MWKYLLYKVLHLITNYSNNKIKIMQIIMRGNNIIVAIKIYIIQIPIFNYLTNIRVKMK